MKRFATGSYLKPLNWIMKKRCLIALLALLSFGKAQDASFAYSSLAFDDCITLNSSEWDDEAPIDFIHQECPSFAGYRIFLKGGDARSWLELQHGDTTYPFSPWDLSNAITGMFPYVKGELAEWRYRLTNESENATLDPYALIYRMSSSDPNYEEDDTDVLIVLRLEKGAVCHIGQALSNEDARIIADDLTQTCN